MEHNPKHLRAQQDGKSPLQYLIPEVLEEEAQVLAHGAEKYGERNWRVDPIICSTYEAAMLRHLFAWIRGEDRDPDSGKRHLAHLRACTTVVMDAENKGTLTDDRNRMESKAAPSPQVDMFPYQTQPPFPSLQGYPNPRCSACQLDPCGCVKG